MIQNMSKKIKVITIILNVGFRSMSLRKRITIDVVFPENKENKLDILICRGKPFLKQKYIKLKPWAQNSRIFKRKLNIVEFDDLGNSNAYGSRIFTIIRQ